MHTYGDKNQENQSKTLANAVSQKKSESKSAFQFVDNRPEAVAQRKLQEMVNNNSQLKQLKAIQLKLNPNAQPFVPQQQPLNANAQPFVPQQQPLNANAQPFVPQQQPLNANAQPFVPQQQPLNANAQAFVPQQQVQVPPYPQIPNNTPVNPAFLNQIINLPQNQQGQYQIIGQWHHGFEIWARNHGFNNGMVAHFNVQAPNGPMLHVYWNAFRQLQVVRIGQNPNGY